MEEKHHGEKIDVVRKNVQSTWRDSGQVSIEIRVIQIRPTMRKTQNYLDFQSKRKPKRNEPFLAWGRESRNWEL